jgi:hypothetical protein
LHFYVDFVIMCCQRLLSGERNDVPNLRDLTAVMHGLEYTINPVWFDRTASKRG